MPRVDSPRFQAWLEAYGDIMPTHFKPVTRCVDCGVEPTVHPFIGEYCVVCLAYRFGYFEKAQEIAGLMLQAKAAFMKSDLNELAWWIYSQGMDQPMPLATE